MRNHKTMKQLRILKHKVIKKIKIISLKIQ